MLVTRNKFVTVRVEPYGSTLKARKDTRLLEALGNAGLKVRSECGGKGICHKCKIIVKDPLSLAEVGDWKGELTYSELKSGYRLACQCAVISDATIYIPEESRVMTRKFLIEGTERQVMIEPAIRKMLLRIPPPSLKDIRSDAERVCDALRETYRVEAVRIDHSLQRKMSRILRKADWRVTVTVWNDSEIISMEEGDTSEKAYGIAVDIGTSKIIIYLSDLISGRIVVPESLENPLIKYGEDIISRISYATKSDAHLKEMQNIVIRCLNNMTSEACKKLRINPAQVYELTVVGNTAMHHLFLGIQPKHLGLSPYVPVVSDPIDEKARNLSLKANPAANVHIFPVIAGFVGGDAVADIVSTGIYEADVLSMVLDIGTNAEVILGDKDSLTVCSCASGPAFEGAHIECGVKSVTGAIERLEIEPRKYSVNYETIGNTRPVGLCGSAIIDAVANLLKCQLIDREGKFIKDTRTPQLIKMDGKRAFVIASKKQGAARNIMITQEDIEEIQLAKAAIYAGCSILMDRKHVKPHNIKKLYVAGAFGNYIDPTNAKIIGLLPDIPESRITFVGNAAGAGARMALISRSLRQVAASVSRKVDYIELALEPDFQSEFAAAMFFPHRDLDRFRSIKELL